MSDESHHRRTDQKTEITQRCDRRNGQIDWHDFLVGRRWENRIGMRLDAPSPTMMNPAKAVIVEGAAMTQTNPAAAMILLAVMTLRMPSHSTRRSPNRRPVEMATEKTAKARPAVSGATALVVRP